jgi:hypothetical protein
VPPGVWAEGDAVPPRGKESAPRFRAAGGVEMQRCRAVPARSFFLVLFWPSGLLRFKDLEDAREKLEEKIQNLFLR